VNNLGSMHRGKEEAGQPAPTTGEGLPWLAIGGGLVAAIVVGVVLLAWVLGGPRPAVWIEQPLAAPANAKTGNNS